ncbi:hypothetical protein AVEN_72730-1 [Araneus ventricosus]|uniref:Uncharacterized protein n=1 Tax=Araneus ventricosus TaxID=182803 RepID=A0A4Y2DQT7_ARAVE|nr:hypothetical protein AVEN_72730-1 [Araneus ventricosus]
MPQFDARAQFGHHYQGTPNWGHHEHVDEKLPDNNTRAISGPQSDEEDDTSAGIPPLNFRKAPSEGRLAPPLRMI